MTSLGTNRFYHTHSQAHPHPHPQLQLQPQENGKENNKQNKTKHCPTKEPHPIHLLFTFSFDRKILLDHQPFLIDTTLYFTLLHSSPFYHTPFLSSHHRGMIQTSMLAFLSSLLDIETITSEKHT